MTTKRSIRIDYQTMHPDSDIRISNQFLITRALNFAQLQAYYQASVTITFYKSFNSSYRQ